MPGLFVRWDEAAPTDDAVFSRSLRDNKAMPGMPFIVKLHLNTGCVSTIQIALILEAV